MEEDQPSQHGPPKKIDPKADITFHVIDETKPDPVRTKCETNEAAALINCSEAASDGHAVKCSLPSKGVLKQNDSAKVIQAKREKGRKTSVHVQPIPVGPTQRIDPLANVTFYVTNETKPDLASTKSETNAASALVHCREAAANDVDEENLHGNGVLSLPLKDVRKQNDAGEDNQTQRSTVKESPRSTSVQVQPTQVGPAKKTDSMIDVTFHVTKETKLDLATTKCETNAVAAVINHTEATSVSGSEKQNTNGALNLPPKDVQKQNAPCEVMQAHGKTAKKTLVKVQPTQVGPAKETDPKIEETFHFTEDTKPDTFSTKHEGKSECSNREIIHFDGKAVDGSGETSHENVNLCKSNNDTSNEPEAEVTKAQTEEAKDRSTPNGPTRPTNQLNDEIIDATNT